MSLFIYSHNMASEGAKALADALKIKKIKHENSRFKGNNKKTVINWGCSSIPSNEVEKCQVLNRPERVSLCANKLSFFNTIGHIDLVPPWTTDMEEAIEWVGQKSTVCARTILNGHSAAGLVLMEYGDPKSFVRARLYTKYVKKTEEYRVHVINREVVDVQRKVLSTEKGREMAERGEEPNWKIRNLANGFIYQRNNINPHRNVVDVSVQAMTQMGLDFGAVDVIWNEKAQQAYVLEINTAPGLVGTTVNNYANAFRRYL